MFHVFFVVLCPWLSCLYRVLASESRSISVLAGYMAL